MKWYLKTALVIQIFFVALLFAMGSGFSLQQGLAHLKQKALQLIAKSSPPAALLPSKKPAGFVGLTKERSAASSPAVPLAPPPAEEKIPEASQLESAVASPVSPKQEALESLLNRDPHLQLMAYPSKNFDSSTLKKKLEQLSRFRIYVLAEFERPLNFPLLNRLQKLGFATLHNYHQSEYVGKRLAVFYVRYRNLKPLNRLSTKKKLALQQLYLLETYTAKGYYKLSLTANEAHPSLTVNIKLPYSKPEKKLLYKKNHLVGAEGLLEQRGDEVGLTATLSFKKNQAITLYSEVRYLTALETLLERHVRHAGVNTYLEAYQQKMKQQAPALYRTFTGFSEKVVPSAYIDSLVSRLDPSKSLSAIWSDLYRMLNREIRYDWKKRDLFFRGDLTYYDIKDMYMTAEELGEKRIGACPERTSLEIAILRQLGFAARTATRLYHIYTEIYLPDQGWVSTSATLNEIPLCESVDEKMAYFVSWSPKHPIRLKWEGNLYPAIVYQIPHL